MRTRVLVVAQQTALRATIARTLLSLGYGVELASNEKSARPLLRKELFAAAIVVSSSATTRDVSFLREVEATVGKLAILSEDKAVVKRFAQSFPDALVGMSHPLDSESLLLFVGSAPRKIGTGDVAGATLEIENFTLDLAGHALFDRGGREVLLTRGEFALLAAFVSSPGRVLSRGELRRAISGGRTDAYDRSVDMLVARLRRKIEPQDRQVRFIVTVPGVGYKFVAQIRTVGVVAKRPQPPAAVHDELRGISPIERRQLTVLSCQILGFAALAAALDPEELKTIIGSCYAACIEVIERFGGTTDRCLGDSVLAYFGHPKARETDVESAVRAALELIRVISRFEAPNGEFRARIGVATGLLVVGDNGRFGNREPLAIGEALNLAVDLQRAAPADGVVIAPSTRALVGGLFTFQAIAPVTVEAGHDLVTAWRVIDEAAPTPRFEALRREGMLDLVGRHAEIERLLQVWSKAQAGRGQVVLVTGEAGIGKSRLVIELEERLKQDSYFVIRYSGLPHQADAPMAALLNELEKSAGIGAKDASAQKFDRLCDALAACSVKRDEAVAVATNLLGLASETASHFDQLSPLKRRERTFVALLSRIESVTRRRPVLAIVEDVQWIDPTSLEFIAHVVERANSLRLLLVIAGRSEFSQPWPDYPHILPLPLSRLSRSDSATLIQLAAGDRRISPTIEAQILSRADGVPLFVEELTQSVLESESEVRRGRGRPAPNRETIHGIPSSLEGLLLARLDRLAHGKRIAQAGAVIGRVFSFELLRTVVGADETTLVAALDELVSSGLAFRRGAMPQASFVFKHALVRDAAYNMLLRPQRRELHANVARSYEELFPEVADAQPELLAQHWSEAGNPIKAVAYLVTAAQRALHRSAAAQALTHLLRGRELISNQPVNSDRLELELKLEITLARALIATRGYTASETREAYRRARKCCEALDDQASLPLVIHGQWLAAWVAADHLTALQLAHELYSWGKRNNSQVGFTVAHADIGMTLTTLGRLVEARRHLDQALRINNFVLPGRQPFVASDSDGRISALSFMHNCLLLLGFPEQATAAANEAAAIDQENLYSRALAQMRMLRMYVLARDALGAAEGGISLIRLAHEQGYRQLVGLAMIYTGWGQAQLGEVGSGTALCERGLTELENVGGKSWLPLSLALVAECRAQSGDFDHAAACVARALERIEATNERIWESELHRLKGKILLDSGGAIAAVEQSSRTALDKARGRQAKLLELRAATSLAHVLILERESERAFDVLAAVYASFTEGYDFIELREAKALLDHLSGNGARLVNRAS